MGAARARPITNTFDDGLLAAVNGANQVWFVNAMCDERLRFLHALRTWPRFGKGWSARVSDLRAYCLRVATGAPATQAVGLISDLDDTALLHPTGKAIDHPEMLSLDSAIMHPVMLEAA